MAVAGVWQPTAKPDPRPALRLDWDQVAGWRLRRHRLDERAPAGELLGVVATARILDASRGLLDSGARMAGSGSRATTLVALAEPAALELAQLPVVHRGEQAVRLDRGHGGLTVAMVVSAPL